MRKGQERVFIIRMIRLNSSSARQSLPNSIAFEKSSCRTEWGFKPRAAEVLTSNNSSSPGSTATITTTVFRVKRWHKREKNTSFFKNDKNKKHKKKRNKTNEMIQWEKVMQRIILMTHHIQRLNRKEYQAFHSVSRVKNHPVRRSPKDEDDDGWWWKRDNYHFVTLKKYPI